MNRVRFSKKSFVYIVIILLILYIIFFDSASFYKAYKLKHKLVMLQQDINELTKENERLEIENKKLQKDKNTLEKKAREIGMQKEGEEIFRFKESDDF